MNLYILNNSQFRKLNVQRVFFAPAFMPTAYTQMTRLNHWKVLPRPLGRGSDNQQHRALALNLKVQQVNAVLELYEQKNTGI